MAVIRTRMRPDSTSPLHIRGGGRVIRIGLNCPDRFGHECHVPTQRTIPSERPELV